MKILAESAVSLDLVVVARAVSGGDDELVRRLEVFFAERLEFYLREAKGLAYDVVKAVLASGADDVEDAIARAEAVTAMRGSEDFLAVSAAFKRMKNILAQAKDEMPDRSGQEEMRGTVPAQAALLKKSQEVSGRTEYLTNESKYEDALTEIAKLRPEIDTFFGAVMIMDPDPFVRAGRLALLRAIVSSFSRIADFSEIVVAG